MAPPLYERHVHDRVWSDNSPPESPVVSITDLSHGLGHLIGGTGDGYFGYDPALNGSQQQGIDAHLLGQNLHRLNLWQLSPQRLSPQSVHLPEHRATFSLEGSSHPGECDENDNSPSEHSHRSRPQVSSSSTTSITTPTTSHLAAPQVCSPPTHLLRANSSFKLDNLTMVPSYNQAIKSGTNDELLAPAYKPPMPGSSVNLAEVNRRFEELTTAQQQQQQQHAQSGSGKLRSISRGSSLSNLRGLTLPKPLSTGSSPLHSRNHSLNNLPAMTSLSSSGRHRGGGGGGGGGNGSGSGNGGGGGGSGGGNGSSSSRPSSAVNSRNSSFMNLQSDGPVPCLSPTNMLRRGSSVEGHSPGSSSSNRSNPNHRHSLSALLPSSMQGLSLLNLTKKKDPR